MNTDLITFLRARLDEDETRAQAALDEWDQDAMEWEDLPDASYAHARWHDPARVLREIEAGRAILGRHMPVRSSGRTMCEWCLSAITFWPCPDLRNMAAIYSDHPDYQQKWAS